MMFLEAANEAVTRGYTPENTPPVTMRTTTPTAHLPTVFVDSLVDAFATTEYRTFVCGPVPILVDLLPLVPEESGYTVYTDGHFPTIKRKGKVIYFAAAWFDTEVTAEHAKHLWFSLDGLVRRQFGGVGLHSTPGTTGKATWLTTVPEEGLPTLPVEVQQLIRANSGQGRLEHFTPEHDDDGAMVGTVYELDQRWSYAALLQTMPVGRPEVLDGTGAGRWLVNEPYAQGLVDASWEAPAGWKHCGILPSRSHDFSAFPLVGRGVVSRVELDLAIASGWSVDCHSALAFPETVDVFRTWLAKMLRISRKAPILKRQVRSIILHMIGGIHGADRRRTEYGDTPPENATRVRLLTGGERFAWTITEPGYWPETHHPEWSSLVWARGRRRLLDAPTGTNERAGALHLPPNSLVAFRTDAIYTTFDPHWHDDGTNGRYRCKAAHKVAEWPTTMSELMEAKRR